MKRGSISSAARSGRILVSDGAWGTFLYKKGLGKGDCPELWCLDHPDAVRDIAASYIAAGADMIETNSFGGSSIRLAGHGLAARAAELNEAAARISRSAAGEDRWVIASMGPTGKFLLMGDVTEDEMRDSFAEQARALASGGADALCVETMMDADEARIAVAAAKQATGLEVICTFTFDKTVQGYYRTMTGLSPEDAATAALDAGADIVGTNCGNGFAGMIDVVRAMKSATRGRPIMVQANAGLPVNQGGVDSYPEGPSDMAALLPQLLDAGANIVGGCCGTTPEHIAALRRAVDAYMKSHNVTTQKL
jgi:Methionine synthase I (cobalamin-dependent), methyltransferase domain